MTEAELEARNAYETAEVRERFLQSEVQVWEYRIMQEARFLADAYSADDRLSVLVTMVTALRKAERALNEYRPQVTSLLSQYMKALPVGGEVPDAH
jgi:hypothetical protein